MEQNEESVKRIPLKTEVISNLTYFKATIEKGGGAKARDTYYQCYDSLNVCQTHETCDQNTCEGNTCDINEHTCGGSCEGYTCVYTCFDTCAGRPTCQGILVKCTLV